MLSSLIMLDASLFWMNLSTISSSDKGPFEVSFILTKINIKYWVYQYNHILLKLIRNSSQNNLFSQALKYRFSTYPYEISAVKKIICYLSRAFLVIRRPNWNFYEITGGFCNAILAKREKRTVLHKSVFLTKTQIMLLW